MREVSWGGSEIAESCRAILSVTRCGGGTTPGDNGRHSGWPTMRKNEQYIGHKVGIDNGAFGRGRERRGARERERERRRERKDSSSL